MRIEKFIDIIKSVAEEKGYVFSTDYDPGKTSKIDCSCSIISKNYHNNVKKDYSTEKKALIELKKGLWEDLYILANTPVLNGVWFNGVQLTIAFRNNLHLLVEPGEEVFQVMRRKRKDLWVPISGKFAVCKYLKSAMQLLDEAKRDDKKGEFRIDRITVTDEMSQYYESWIFIDLLKSVPNT